MGPNSKEKVLETNTGIIYKFMKILALSTGTHPLKSKKTWYKRLKARNTSIKLTKTKY